MDAKRAGTLAAVSITAFLLLLFLLWKFLGLSDAFLIIASLDVAAILAIFTWALLVWYTALDRAGGHRSSLARRSMASLNGDKELRLEYSFLRKVAGLPTKFRYEALEAATDGFQSLVGSGSSGSVFKGILDDGTPVAVKRIEETSEKGDREFRSEVSAIASVQHVNLVRLFGYCLLRNGARFLVYDYIDNGSLDKWIFSSSPSSSSSSTPRGCLPWRLRYSAAIDVAKALAYLHGDCRLRVLHLDVKPENILLNGSFGALVTDFGLSKLMGRDESRVVPSMVRGTRGYLAPEWFLGQGVSEKCDIFSYGMVLLEMVAGRRSLKLTASEKKWSYLPMVVMEKLREGRVLDVVDERLTVMGGSAEEKQVRVVVEVALWCMQEKSQMRPSMARVVDMLQGREAVKAPPLDNDMIMLDFLNIDDRSVPMTAAPLGQQPGFSPLNSFAMSMISGR